MTIQAGRHFGIQAGTRSLRASWIILTTMSETTTFAILFGFGAAPRAPGRSTSLRWARGFVPFALASAGLWWLAPALLARSAALVFNRYPIHAARPAGLVASIEAMATPVLAVLPDQPVALALLADGRPARPWRGGNRIERGRRARFRGRSGAPPSRDPAAPPRGAHRRGTPSARAGAPGPGPRPWDPARRAGWAARRAGRRRRRP